GRHEAASIRGHLRDIVRCAAAGLSDSRIVKDHNRAVFRQGIHNRRIPRVHETRKVLKQDERRSIGRSQSAMRERRTTGLDEFRWCGLQRLHTPYLNSISLMSIDTTSGAGAAFPSGWRG